MSTCVDVVPEQVCYISCNFCHIVLAVSVPCSSLLDIVTVRCGHCTNLWSVNMAAVFQQLSRQDHIQGGRVTYNPDYKNNMDPLASSSRCNQVPNFRAPLAASNGERLPVDRQPEKRLRVPSAYNQFIKEEIQRIKANNPDINHREAFSTAAKNWAHFPYIHFGLNLEPNKQAKLAEGSGNRMMSKPAMCNE